MTEYSWIFTLVVMGLVLYGIYRVLTMPFRGRGKVAADGKFICQSCGARGEPRTRTKGSIWIEVILWLAFILPGLIYSVWRLTTKEQVCPACDGAGMIPVKTPRGQQLAREFQPK